jgi:glycosyltransferase involved in cell wall biosynthesis
VKRHIVFWLGKSHSTWNHRKALEEGCGGSELAAIHLSQNLAALGFQVTMYADIEETDPQGLNPWWCRYDDFELSSRVWDCDLLISSRCPSFVGARKRALHGKPSWLWMHDLHVGADWEHHLSLNFDKVVCLSKFASHRLCAYYPKVDERKVLVIPNGIDLGRFPVNAEQPFAAQHVRWRAREEPLRMIWSSCPDRGLDVVIGLQPALRAEFPNARLEVYGDLSAWLSKVEDIGSEDQISFARKLMRKIGELDSHHLGAEFCGKVGQQKLARAFSRSHVWFYPTSFEETSCITAMEAQAAGTKIVCTSTGALPETAPNAVFVSAPSATRTWQMVAVAVIRATMVVNDDEALLKSRADLTTWGEVASSWRDAILEELARR